MWSDKAVTFVTNHDSELVRDSECALLLTDAWPAAGGPSSFSYKQRAAHLIEFANSVKRFASVYQVGTL